MIRRNNIFSFVSWSLLFAGTLLLDQFVKIWSYDVLRLQKSMVVIPNIISLTYRENTGAAFSILEGKTFFLTIITFLVALLIVFAILSGRIKNIVAEYALLFIAAGGIGNCIDRISRGFVVDMFEFTFINFAVFNVADIFVTCGSVMFILIFLATKGDVIKW